MNRPAQKAEKEVPLIVVKNERERHDACNTCKIDSRQHQHSLLDVLHDDNKQPLQPTINNNHTQGGIAAILIPRRSK